MFQYLLATIPIDNTFIGKVFDLKTLLHSLKHYLFQFCPFPDHTSYNYSGTINKLCVVKPASVKTY